MVSRPGATGRHQPKQESGYHQRTKGEFVQHYLRHYGDYKLYPKIEILFNRPGVAGAVLRTPLSLID